MAKSHARHKSWRYTNSVKWTEGKRGNLRSQGKPDFEVATPADFGGPEGVWTPEDLLVAAVNSCVMTTFLYHQAKADFELLEYESNAEGRLIYGEGGLKVTEITVHPVILVGAEAEVEKARQAIERAEEGCLISGALDCNVIVEPTVEAER